MPTWIYKRVIIHNSTSGNIRLLDRNMDHGGDDDAIYLDFSKCFDSIPHEWLLMKLQKYGITGKLWRWVGDFLRGKSQQVSL